MSDETKKIVIAMATLLVLFVCLLVIRPYLSPKPDPEAKEFWTWALGSDWKEVVADMKNVPARWNERHGDLFELHGDDSVREGRKRMYDAWKVYDE